MLSGEVGQWKRYTWLVWVVGPIALLPWAPVLSPSPHQGVDTRKSPYSFSRAVRTSTNYQDVIQSNMRHTRLKLCFVMLWSTTIYNRPPSPVQVSLAHRQLT